MEVNAWYSRCRTFKVNGSFPTGGPRKHPRKHGMRLKEKKVNTDLAQDRNVWKSFIRNCPTHASMEKRRLNQYDYETGLFQTSK